MAPRNLEDNVLLVSVVTRAQPLRRSPQQPASPLAANHSLGFGLRQRCRLPAGGLGRAAKKQQPGPTVAPPAHTHMPPAGPGQSTSLPHSRAERVGWFCRPLLGRITVELDRGARDLLVALAGGGDLRAGSPRVTMQPEVAKNQKQTGMLWHQARPTLKAARGLARRAAAIVARCV